MDRTILNRWRWQILQWRWRSEERFWSGLVLVVLAFCLAYKSIDLAMDRLAKSRPAEERVADEILRADVADEEDAVNAYYQALPREEDRFALVARVLRLAREAGLSSQEADHLLEHESTTQVARYRLSLPLRGPFQKVQAYLLQVLYENRFVGIDLLQVKREAVHSAEVECRVQFSMLMRRSTQTAIPAADVLGDNRISNGE